IPAERMKGSRAHVIYLPNQAQDLMIGLQMCAGGSEFLLPGRYSVSKPLSNGALNRLINTTVEAVNEAGGHLDELSVHDLRRTASTLL
ncbi:tyrosine-type recombinase/integrase, partial [Escherichia coli]